MSLKRTLLCFSICLSVVAYFYSSSCRTEHYPLQFDNLNNEPGGIKVAIVDDSDSNVVYAGGYIGD